MSESSTRPGAVAGGSPVEDRTAARVLLLRGWDPADPGRSWWMTPGGGLEPGEDAARGAVREVFEETGLRLDPADLLGPVWEHTVEFSFDGRSIRQRQGYFAVRCAPWTVDHVNRTEMEREALGEERWWSVADLRATSETVFPPELADLLRDVARRMA